MRGSALAAPLAILAVVGGCKAAPTPEPAYCTAVPQIAFKGRVTDAAAILGEEEEARLSARLAKYQTRTSHQMAIVTVSSLNRASIDDFSVCVGNRWKSEQKDDADSVMILMAPNERRIRVATSRGMEELLPDEKAKTAIDLMTPYFKNGDYAGGLSAGVEAIAAQTGDPQ